MMVTVTNICEEVRKKAFSLSMLLETYLRASDITAGAFSPIDHIKYMERLRNLVVGIKFSIQKRFWRQPDSFNELFDEDEVLDVKWVQRINPLWLALLGTSTITDHSVM